MAVNGSFSDRLVVNGRFGSRLAVNRRFRNRLVVNGRFGSRFVVNWRFRNRLIINGRFRNRLVINWHFRSRRRDIYIDVVKMVFKFNGNFRLGHLAAVDDRQSAFGKELCFRHSVFHREIVNAA